MSLPFSPWSSVLLPHCHWLNGQPRGLFLLLEETPLVLCQQDRCICLGVACQPSSPGRYTQMESSDSSVLGRLEFLYPCDRLQRRMKRSTLRLFKCTDCQRLYVLSREQLLLALQCPFPHPPKPGNPLIHQSSLTLTEQNEVKKE